jgi:hypothetical protein
MEKEGKKIKKEAETKIQIVKIEKKWEKKYKMERKEARKIGSILTVEKTNSSQGKKKRG